MNQETWSRRRVLGALATGVAGGVAGCSFGAPENEAPETSRDPIATIDGTFDSYAANGDSTADGSTYTRVYNRVSPSVAAVRVRQELGSTASGTAWVYDDSHLVTNEHVVSGAAEVSVWFDGTGWQDAEVVATDVYSDLAVLRVEDRPESAGALPLVQWEPPTGTQVIALGNPFGLSGSVSAGIISGQNRTLPAGTASNDFSIPDAVQTDAAVNPGNSGGPLVTLDGQVAGVVNSGGGDNIGFAISAAMVRRVVPALIQDGEYDHSYMGVRLTGVTPPIAEANDLPISWGVYIASVVDGGPSDGVLQGSTGQTTLDGQRIETGGDVVYRMGGADIPTQQALSSYLALETSPGDTIDVAVIRDGRRQTVQLTLGERPPP
ncbi:MULTISPECIES: S1C family serine protease [Salinibaculum]|uniref:S1C family serine protease n=1 Tax=Salinibaculum TaxID=2732368 RepID=UPI0030D2A19D